MNGSYRNGMTCRKDGRNDKDKQTRLAWHIEEKICNKQRSETRNAHSPFPSLNSKWLACRKSEVHIFFLSLVADPTRYLWTDNWGSIGLRVSGRRWRLRGNVHPGEFFLAALICWLKWCDFMRNTTQRQVGHGSGRLKGVKKKKIWLDDSHCVEFILLPLRYNEGAHLSLWAILMR